MDIMLKKLSLAIVVAFFSLSTAANADIIAIFAEVGNNVVVTASGSLDLTGANQLSDWTNTNGFTGTWGDTDIAIVSRASSGTMDRYAFSSLPATVVQAGTGPLTRASTTTGTNWGINFNWLFLPDGYDSGTQVDTTWTFNNASFASLGYNVGQYDYELPNDVVSLVVAVPEPAFGLMLGVVGAIGLTFRRRRS